jgi:hypothetical protein
MDCELLALVSVLSCDDASDAIDLVNVLLKLVVPTYFLFYFCTVSAVPIPRKMFHPRQCAAAFKLPRQIY